MTCEVYVLSYPGLLSNSRLCFKASKPSRRVYIVFESCHGSMNHLVAFGIALRSFDHWVIVRLALSLY
jgi:hypothetical protein